MICLPPGPGCIGGMYACGGLALRLTLAIPFENLSFTWMVPTILDANGSSITAGRCVGYAVPPMDGRLSNKVRCPFFIQCACFGVVLFTAAFCDQQANDNTKDAHRCVNP